MRFQFFAPIHNMELDNYKNSGKKIPLGQHFGRITNNHKWFTKVSETPEAAMRIGTFSGSEFWNDKATYIYINGDVPSVFSLKEMNKIGVGYTFYLLRELQGFTDYLWAIKDTNIYVRDGFLIAYEKDGTQVDSYKASLSAINSFANLRVEETTLFSDKEIDEAVNLMHSKLFDFSEHTEEIEEVFDYYSKYKYPTSDIFYTHKGSTRLGRAFFFSLNARNSGSIPMKIMYYVNSLECLFTTTNAELSHRVAERVSLLLGQSSKEKIDLYNIVKRAYGIRSNVVHGSAFRKKDESLEELSIQMDNILRNLITEQHSFFYGKDEELEQKFLSLLFADKYN